MNPQQTPEQSQPFNPNQPFQPPIAQPVTPVQSVPPQPVQQVQPLPPRQPVVSAPVQTSVGVPMFNQPNVDAAGSAAHKKIKNSASSVFWLGVLLTVLLPIGILGGLSSNNAHKGATIVLLLITLAPTIEMIVYGRKLKKATSPSQALPLISVSTGLCLAVVLLSVIESIVVRTHLPLQGLLSLVALVYLLVIRQQIGRMAL